MLDELEEIEIAEITDTHPRGPITKRMNWDPRRKQLRARRDFSGVDANLPVAINNIRNSYQPQKSPEPVHRTLEFWNRALSSEKYTEGQSSAILNYSLFLNFLVFEPKRSKQAIYRALRQKLPRDVVARILEIVSSAVVRELSTTENIRSSIIGELNDLVARAKQLESNGFDPAALDLIYGTIGRFLRAHKFEEVNLLLSSTPTNDLSIRLILGILTSSLPASHKLPSRRSFFQSAKSTLIKRNEYQEDLLYGLER